MGKKGSTWFSAVKKAFRSPSKDKERDKERDVSKNVAKPVDSVGGLSAVEAPAVSTRFLKI